MANEQHIYIRNNGTRTLYTSGSYLNNDIIIDVNVPQGFGSNPTQVDGLIFDSYQALLMYMRSNGLTPYTIEVVEDGHTSLEN